jgi:hypothetical protein
MPRLSSLTVILIVAAAMLAVALVSVLAWAVYSAYLNWIERRLASRKRLYRDLVASLAARERELLEPELQRRRTLYDLEALEAVLEEQARSTAGFGQCMSEARDLAVTCRTPLSTISRPWPAAWPVGSPFLRAG